MQQPLLPTCSKRWREFVLPARIRRESIVASGYRYGEYRFSLDQHQVLDLLMGENLYDSPYVFVREMLQNALDASRLREHLERLRGDKDFKAQPIRVSEWLDRDRYRWVRFDDFGTGMDEQIVRDHLLKVGSSYYTSAQYEADKLRASKGVGSDFVPISRFGIGLLSCFIAGDRVEISTLRQLPGRHSRRPRPPLAQRSCTASTRCRRRTSRQRRCQLGPQSTTRSAITGTSSGLRSPSASTLAKSGIFSIQKISSERSFFVPRYRCNSMGVTSEVTLGLLLPAPGATAHVLRLLVPNRFITKFGLPFTLST